MRSGDYLTVNDFARATGVAASTVYALVARGAVPALKIGRLWRIPASALDPGVRPASVPEREGNRSASGKSSTLASPRAPGAKRTMGGLRGSISRTPGGRYRARIDAAGAPGRRVQLSKTFDTREEAARWIAAQNLTRPTASPIRASLGDYLTLWLESVAPSVKPHTLASYATAAKRWTSLLGTADVGEITPLQIQMCVNAMARRLSPETVRRTFAVLRTAFRQGAVWGLLQTDPTAGVKMPRRRAAPDGARVWTPEEARRAMQAARATRYAIVFRLALAAGMRLGEILGLVWSDVDLDGAVLRVRRSLSWPRYGRPELVDVKSPSSRRDIPVDRDTVGWLEEHRRLNPSPDDGPWGRLVVRTLNGGPVQPRRIERLMPVIARRAGVPRIRFHDLRHTHATLLLRAGHSVKEVSARLGHSDPAITLRVYAHVLDDQRAALAETMGAILRP